MTKISRKSSKPIAPKKKITPSKLKNPTSSKVKNLCGWCKGVVHHVKDQPNDSGFKKVCCCCKKERHNHAKCA